MPQFIQWVQDNDRDIGRDVEILAASVSQHLRDRNIEEASKSYTDLLTHMDNLSNLLEDYEEERSGSPTFRYWQQYMELISILLTITRSLRCGDWHLYLSPFKGMLPWFAVYDHLNHTKWGFCIRCRH